jgi:glutamate--cysteine ligase catalytic subunit
MIKDEETPELCCECKFCLKSCDKPECINEYSNSQYVFDDTCNPHPRFRYLVKSIRERRGEKVSIDVPIYQDKYTDMTAKTYEEPIPGKIHMDAMHFGMGCSCLQVTVESQSINHSRYLYDQLLPFGPILAAISASAPIYKGKLSNIDMRWQVIE